MIPDPVTLARMGVALVMLAVGAFVVAVFGWLARL